MNCSRHWAGISGIRPRTDQTPTGQAAVSGSFDELLDKAREGAITTDSAVKIAKGPFDHAHARSTASCRRGGGCGGGQRRIPSDDSARRPRLPHGCEHSHHHRRGAVVADSGDVDVDAVVAAPASDEELAARPVKINPPSGAAIDVSNTALRQLLESSGNAA
jgi:hypothetical protein